jgi:hypothetical protein
MEKMQNNGLRIFSEEADMGPTWWFWIDDDCEEPMGPFDSYRDAMADYRDTRPAA